ncbi:MAG: anhydro-N-acetylmuramic acid kinase [Steroidobacteraceae bacterium]
MALYIGMMSGTSMDGVDAVLLEIAGAAMKVRGARHEDYPAAILNKLRGAVEYPGSANLDLLGSLDVEIGEAFARCALGLLQETGVAAREVRAIGSHGQTVLHRPRSPTRFTMQIGDPNVIAERVGVDVVADFRRRDLAAGGEAAPLMPIFHREAFACAGESRAVVNIGGIGNITLLAADGGVRGYDTGPGNCLMDSWILRNRGEPFDRDGCFSASGKVHDALLQKLLQETYFALPAPKSTGRELFNLAWLDAKLHGVSVSSADVQATLCELTATSIARELSAAGAKRVFICGGGAFNPELMKRLGIALPGATVASTAIAGIAPEHVEGAGFALLAHLTLARRPGNIPEVTGAAGLRVLGAVYAGAVTHL